MEYIGRNSGCVLLPSFSVMTDHPIVRLLCVAGGSAVCVWWCLKRNTPTPKQGPLITALGESDVPRCGCIIKLGGSACTKKDSFETFNFDEVSRFSEQLADIYASDSEFKPVVVHGAGSFGHFQAKQYSVGAGATSASGAPSTGNERISSFLREGFAKTRLSVTRLNHHIITTLIQKGIPAVGVSPFPIIPASQRRMASETASWPWRRTLISSLSETLSLGLVPVLHGDACIDPGSRATSILSGDTLFVDLCKVFRPTHAVFLADVEGVLSGPPNSQPYPELISKILVRADGSWCSQSITTSCGPNDVTGGIKLKIQSAVEVVQALRIPVYIVKAGSVDAQLAMRGIRPTAGTTVEFQS